MKLSTLGFLLSGLMMVGGCTAGSAYLAISLAGVTAEEQLPNPGEPDLRPAFEQADHEKLAETIQDAIDFADVNDEVAKILEADGNSTEPQFTTGIAASNLRKLTIFWERGESFYRYDYPKLKDICGGYLNKKFQGDQGKLLPEHRAQLVEAHRQIAKSARFAAQELSQ
ncbi:hypothetical protein [Blastopirellula retiformator]|uniref:Uncharacterized protein n=1 Tax=Blastopirellula retiformator TaxID=2527970 RepID=A0A5C5UWE0_9BACT|nr:hypothetical protein [Blastopirellula retiformator]TWT30694.1 hypothetical protein Enr8_42170 [Blastopirellula retiformator]